MNSLGYYNPRASWQDVEMKPRSREAFHLALSTLAGHGYSRGVRPSRNRFVLVEKSGQAVLRWRERQVAYEVDGTT